MSRAREEWELRVLTPWDPVKNRCLKAAMLDEAARLDVRAWWAEGRASEASPAAPNTEWVTSKDDLRALAEREWDRADEAAPVRLYTAKAASATLGISVRKLGEMRFDGTGPDYVQLGSIVRYSRAALERWVKEMEEKHGSF